MTKEVQETLTFKDLIVTVLFTGCNVIESSIIVLAGGEVFESSASSLGQESFAQLENDFG